MCVQIWLRKYANFPGVPSRSPGIWVAGLLGLLEPEPAVALWQWHCGQDRWLCCDQSHWAWGWGWWLEQAAVLWEVAPVEVAALQWAAAPI